MRADDDDLLRSALSRERANATTYDARAALESIRPGMDRVRRRKMLARTGAAGVLAIGSFGVAAWMLSGPASVRTGIGDEPAPGISPDRSPDPRVVPDSTEHAVEGHVEQGGEDASSVGILAGTSGAPDGATPVGSAPTDSTALAHATDPAPDAAGTDELKPDPGPSLPTATAPVVAPEPAGPPPTDLPSRQPGGEPGPTTVPGATPGGPEWFTCSCGSVLADRSSGAVVVVEVRPAAGYTYRLEDRQDDGDQTIQFTGTGEDCELTIRHS